MPPACCQGMGFHVRLHSPCCMHLLRLGAGNVNCRGAPVFLPFTFCAQELYGHLPRVRTPRIFWAHTTRRVLTMVCSPKPGLFDPGHRCASCPFAH